MHLTQEQLLIELNRQLEKVCAMDRIDRQTIRSVQERIQELTSMYPSDDPDLKFRPPN
jgi:hypothetical protein